MPNGTKNWFSQNIEQFVWDFLWSSLHKVCRKLNLKAVLVFETDLF